MMPMVLVVDDDMRLRELLGKFLIDYSYRVQTAANAAQARAQLASQHFDMMILDIMMPKETGLELLASMRRNQSSYKQIPVILLTAQDGLDEKIHGLMSGADDYLTKPFEPKELIARIETVLRRTNIPRLVGIDLYLGNYVFKVEKASLFKNSEEVRLTSTEQMVLRILAQHPNQPFSRTDLAHRIGFVISDRSIDVQINRLRRKLEDDAGKYLKTIRHVGYALCPDS
jgi:two-component system, OmpR family, phosphate regulon response regulator OmpR